MSDGYHGSRHEKLHMVEREEDWEKHDPFNHCLSLAANKQSYLPNLV